MSVRIEVHFTNPDITNGPVEVISWSHVTADRSQRVDPRPPEFILTRYLDNASMALMQAVWRGQTFERVTITQSAPSLFLQVILQNATLNTHKLSGGASDIPVEELSLSYGTLTYNYKDPKAGLLSATTSLPVVHDA